NTEKGDPSAAFLLDGVYIARPQAQEVSFFDVNRVEVLRGPQGTLYGRNTTAGLVNVITNRPVDDFEAAANFTVGNFGTIRGDAMINVPAGDKVAFRVAGAMERRDSYLVKVPGDTSSIDPYKDNYSVRGQALFTINDSVNFLLRADYSKLQGSPQNVVLANNFYAPIASGAPAYTNPAYIGGQHSSRELRSIGYDLSTDPTLDGKTWGIDGELNWDVGPLTMTYLGSHREFSQVGLNASVNGRGPFTSTFDGDFKQNSHELRFAANDIEALKFQFGAYYFDETSHNSLVLPGIVGFAQGPTHSKSYAFFGQGIYSLTDLLRVTAGGRWSHDDKDRVGRTYNPVTNALISPNDASTSSSKFTWRLGLDYDLDANSLLYGVVSTGYKAGGFNGGCEAGTPNCANPRPNAALYYAPETLTSYEVGLKTKFADNMVRLNASAFYYDYTDLQVSSIGAYNGVPQQVTQNAAAATVKGLELETIVSPGGGHRFNAGVNYLDAHYTDYEPLGLGVPPDFAGLSLDRAPKWVGTLGYSYTYDFQSEATLEFSANTRISSEYFLSSQTNGQRFRQPGFTRSNLSVTFTAPAGRYYIQGYANNLENDIQVSTAGFSQGVSLVTPSDPRTYGVRLGFRF
ncbi:MAG: TonB-dependent receptor, partial [Croceibacterium sp.]